MGLESHSHRIHPSYNPFPQPFPIDCISISYISLTGFCPSLTTKEVKNLAFKSTVMQEELKTAHSPWVSFVCMLAPATSHLICTESKSKLGVGLEFGNSVLAERGLEQKLLFQSVLIPSGLTHECLTEKGILLILTALLSFLVLNLQNSRIRKCLQKGFEEVTEAEAYYSAALSMDKQNMVSYYKEKRA